jgi:DNA polymerase-3 subunit gamma/tau
VELEVPVPLPLPPPVFAPTAFEVMAPAAENGAGAPESRADMDADLLKGAATDALTGSGQHSAAEAVQDAVWTIAGGEVRVETGLSKMMLPAVLNQEAEKLVKAALRDAGAGALKLVLLPGTPAPNAPKPARAARPGSGSAQAKAEGHPMVQAARRLFDAEIQSVIDLSEGDR